jgi:acetyl esterase/lipase
MVDHPMPPPYKGIDDPMPQSLHRMKAAVRTLRALAPEVGGNGKIGVIGFSRGGPFAALLAVTNGRDDLEGDGPHRDVSSAIQAALIHGNRYDYLNLRPDDPMLARLEKAWGKRDANEHRWAEHGASFYLKRDAAPMFLNTSDAESPEYREGLANFAKRLEELGVEHVYQVDADGRGHRVSTDPKTLGKVYEFFATHLK